MLSTSLGPIHTELTSGFNWAFRKWRWDWAFRISRDVYKLARALSYKKKKSETVIDVELCACWSKSSNKVT